MLRECVGSIVLLLFTVVSSGCSGPTSPSCTDKYGRGSSAPDQLLVSCLPSGSDLQCTATATNESGLYVYCPVSLAVTSETTWLSSNSSVASFGQTGSRPGYLTVLAPGQIQISSSYGFLQGEPLAFAVTPGGAPQRMVHLGMIVEDRGSSARLPDVQVTVLSSGSPAQTCETGQAGSCLAWVLPGTVDIQASKNGYAPGASTVAVVGEYSYTQNATLTLVPAAGG